MPIHVKMGDPAYGGYAIGKRTLNLIIQWLRRSPIGTVIGRTLVRYWNTSVAQWRLAWRPRRGRIRRVSVNVKKFSKQLQIHGNLKFTFFSFFFNKIPSNQLLKYLIDFYFCELISRNIVQLWKFTTLLWFHESFAFMIKSFAFSNKIAWNDSKDCCFWSLDLSVRQMWKRFQNKVRTWSAYDRMRKSAKV